MIISIKLFQKNNTANNLTYTIQYHKRADCVIISEISLIDC